MPNINRQLKNTDERGFASIVISLVLILVLALITVGFAQLARREQQDALKKQLAAEANYAAESGINDVYKDIKNGVINDTNANRTNCMTGTGSSSGTRNLPANALSATPTVDASRDISYTCALVDLTPNNLTFSNVAPGSGRHATFSTSATPDPLTISWGSASQNHNFPGSPATQFLPASGWHDAGGRPYPPVIQFSITPLNPADRDSLINRTFNVYLYPSSGPSGSANVTGAQGQILSGGCDTSASSTYPCKVTLTGLSGTQYLIHFIDFYDASNILITGNSGGGSVDFTGEPQIDITGKAKNVLKRLQVRLFVNGNSGSIDNSTILPNNAIEAENTCKRFGAAPSGPDNPIGTTFDSGTSGACILDQ